MELQVLTHHAGNTAKNAIIALHGYGDNASNFSELAKDFGLENTSWHVPNAPREVPQSFGGAQWYDLFSRPDPEMEVSYQGITRLIHSVAREHNLPMHKIFLMGFSQGAYMALYTALRLQEPLGGLIALSGYIGQVHRVPELTEAQKKMPVFVAHGNQDQVVLPHMFYETLDVLTHLGFKNICSKMYKMGHTLCAEEVRDIEAFIKEHR